MSAKPKKKTAKKSAGKATKPKALKLQSLDKLTDLKVVDHPTQPDWVVEKHGEPMAHKHGRGGVVTGTRETEFRGRAIRVTTTYEIRINDKPFRGHIMLNEEGRVYIHACPYRDFGSIIELLKHLIQHYPEDFPPRGKQRNRPPKYAAYHPDTEVWDHDSKKHSH